MAQPPSFKRRALVASIEIGNRRYKRETAEAIAGLITRTWTQNEIAAALRYHLTDARGYDPLGSKTETLTGALIDMGACPPIIDSTGKRWA